MIQNILSHLGGVQHFGILSLCLFCTVFLGVLVWAFLQKKTHLDYMARVALDREPGEPNREIPGVKQSLNACEASVPRRSRATADETGDAATTRSCCRSGKIT